jgi:hypothetical protein
VAILPKKNKKLPLDAPGWWFMWSNGPNTPYIISSSDMIWWRYVHTYIDIHQCVLRLCYIP